MNPIEEHDITCPYCAETFSVVIDLTAGNQRYVQDCEICCQPIEFDVRVDSDNGTAGVDVWPSDE